MKFVSIIKIITILSVVIGGMAHANDGKKYRWRLAETWGANFPIFGDASKNMAKMVHAGTLC